MSKIALLVEDNPDDVHFMERAFSRAEVARPLKSVSNGQQAIDYLVGLGVYADRGEHPLPTHLILDVKLPLRSGFEVLEWVRQESGFRELPVVVLTSSVDKSDRELAEKLGVDGYLVKPVDFTNLVWVAKAIGEWMDTGQTAQFNRVSAI